MSADPINRIEKLQAIAYHEAGHAVMGWYCGARFRSITVRHGRGCQGWVWFCSPMREQARLSPVERLERTVLIHLAGPLAAWPFERRFRALSARHDLERAYSLVDSLSRSPRDTLADWSRFKGARLEYARPGAPVGSGERAGTGAHRARHPDREGGTGDHYPRV